MQPAPLGFTLVETLIVLGLLGIFIGVTVPSGVDEYERVQARSDRELLVSSLRETRAEAMNGTCATCTAPESHGLHISQNQLILFTGPSYATRTQAFDTEVSTSKATHFSTSEADVIFTPFSGDVASPATIQATGMDHQTENVQVTTHGAILASSTYNI